MNLQIYNKYFILNVSQTTQVPYSLSADSGIKNAVGALMKVLNKQSDEVPTEYIWAPSPAQKAAKKKKVVKKKKAAKKKKGYKKK